MPMKILTDAAWTDALSSIWRDQALRLARGRQGLARARERFGEQRYLARLLEIYEGRT